MTDPLTTDKISELKEHINNYKITDISLNNLKNKINDALQYMSFINSGYFLIFLLLHKFKILIIDNDKENIGAYINIDLNKAKEAKIEQYYDEFAETNYLISKTIYLDSKLFTFPKITIRDIIFILSHEMMHLLYKHITRKSNRDHLIWNLAADHVINRELVNKDRNKDKLTFDYFFDMELHNIKPNCSTEEAYDYLINKTNDNSSDSSNNSSNDKSNDKQDSSNNGNYEDNDDEEDYEEENKQKNQKPKIPNAKYEITSSDNGLVEIKNKITNQKYNVITSETTNNSTDPLEDPNNTTNEILDSIFDEARVSYESMNDNFKGNISGNFKSIFSTLFEQPIPWEEILTKSIKTNIQIVPDSRSWATPNKMYRAHNIILPSEIDTEQKNSVGLLVILIDTSGSISDKDLQSFTSVIIQSFGHFNEILLILHDTTIKDIKSFKNHELKDFENYIKFEGYAGRGGTSHRETFSYIEKNIWEDRYKRDELSMIISLTDAYSDINESIMDYKWFLNKTPITFLITPEGDSNYIRLDTDLFTNVNKINMSNSDKQKRI